MPYLSRRIYLWFIGISVLGLSACSKAEYIPEPEPEVVPDTYEVLDMTYFLTENDGIDTTTVSKDPEYIQNSTDFLMKLDHKVSWDNLTKQSSFRINQEHVPEGLDLAEVEVQVPGEYYAEGGFNYYSEKFPLSETDIERPDIASEANNVMHLKIPPHSLFIINNSVEQYKMTCSFKLKIKNERTGAISEISGKWMGTLRYFAYATSIDQEEI